ncbi:MAG: hypothetical protein WKF30_17185 [Pyrinomonadaceae bacterium]
MGYAIALSPCFVCRQIFTYNPVSVPSVRVNGVREAICRTCVERVNPERVKNGLEPIVPLPDAYEPVDEQQLF